jgi:hypothetical protein
MKQFMFWLICILTCPGFVLCQNLLYEEKSDFANSSDKGEVLIESKHTSLRRGENYQIKYTFHVLNGSYAVYNWQFNSLRPLPGQLAIFDAGKQYIGDLIRVTGGSQSMIRDEDWTFLYGETYLSKPLGFRAGLVPGTKYFYMENLLPVGTYYIQLILYRAFISPNPFRVEGDKIDFYKTFNKSELCRSNAIKIEIVDN